MSKGAQTKESIQSEALDLSSVVGLEGLTIGVLSKKLGMSKSGLYAHFGSKEELQINVLDTAGSMFVDYVLRKAIQQPRGLPRVTALFEHWIQWADTALSGGCPLIAAATELDDRPGPVRDKLVKHIQSVHKTIVRTASGAIEEGHFEPNLDLEQFVFEFWSILLGYHHFSRLLNDDKALSKAQLSFSRLIARAQAISVS